MEQADKRLCVGIDTSNYTTSLAACDMSQNIVFDGRIVLSVKPGMRGLRQQEALFQHTKNLPVLVDELMSVIRGGDLRPEIAAVSVSSRPRPVRGSYMPVFTAGESFAKVIAGITGADIYRFSHQEGHIQAAVCGSDIKMPERFLAFHLSGGTTELLDVVRAGAGYDIDIIGGSRDISAGQLIDRVGVALGLDFPCGRQMDEFAVAHEAMIRARGAVKSEDITPGAGGGLLKEIHIDGTWMNLSGIETQCLRLIKEHEDIRGLMSYEVFCRLKAAISRVALNGAALTGNEVILMAGGVSDSRFMALSKDRENVYCSQGYGTDNAVGTAILGSKQWRLIHGASSD